MYTRWSLLRHAFDFHPVPRSALHDFQQYNHDLLAVLAISIMQLYLNIPLVSAVSLFQLICTDL